MELKHYRLIKTIAEEGSIANSSEKLFLTQSALSHQLRELEERLGFKVFFRTRNKWELSDQGKELYRLANQLFQTIEEGFSNINHINNGQKGQVKIGTECYSFFLGMPAFLQKMAILYPQIEIDLISEATHQPIPKLLSKEIDMVIVTSKPASKLVASIELYEEEIFCFMNKEHPFANASHLEAGDFIDLHLIIHSFPLETVSVYEHFLNQHKVMPKKISAIPYLSVGLEMVAANMGVMCISRSILDAFKEVDQLTSKSISTNGLKRTLYLVYRVEDKSKQYITDFIANFREEFLDKNSDVA